MVSVDDLVRTEHERAIDVADCFILPAKDKHMIQADYCDISSNPNKYGLEIVRTPDSGEKIVEVSYDSQDLSDLCRAERDLAIEMARSKTGYAACKYVQNNGSSKICAYLFVGVASHD